MAIPTFAGRIAAAARRAPTPALATGAGRWVAAAGAGALALAALSLLAPYQPVHDAWAWLVWGRELASFELDTSAGPSWKPLPALIAVPLSLAGAGAPELWLAIARAGWILAAVSAWRLASRLALAPGLRLALGERLARRRVRAARLGAGALAAFGVLVIWDPFTEWARQFAGGLSEPLLVALVLGAVERGLAGAHRGALGLGTAAALLRPEAWPLLAFYGAWLWRRERRLRPALVGAGAGLLVAWLGLDLLGSGSPLTGAERAREGSGAPLGEAFEAIGRVGEMALAGLWAAAAYAVWGAWRARERPLLVLAAGLAGWIATVALAAAAGYAGLPRFGAPAAALACVLGGVGFVRLVDVAQTQRGAGAGRAALGACALIALALGVQGGLRATAIPGDLAESRSYGVRLEALLALAATPPVQAALERCEGLSTSDLLTSTALAWRLDRGLGEIQLRPGSLPPRGVAFLSDGTSPALAALAQRRGTPLASRPGWSAYAISCATESDLGNPNSSGRSRVAITYA